MGTHTHTCTDITYAQTHVPYMHRHTHTTPPKKEMMGTGCVSMQGKECVCTSASWQCPATWTCWYSSKCDKSFVLTDMCDITPQILSHCWISHSFFSWLCSSLQGSKMAQEKSLPMVFSIGSYKKLQKAPYSGQSMRL